MWQEHQFQAVKVKYPSPTTIQEYQAVINRRESPKGMYCVGGALIAGVEGSFRTTPRFPSLFELEFWLQKQGIPYEQSMDAAHDILEYNDKGNFRAAWALAHNSLCGVLH